MAKTRRGSSRTLSKAHVGLCQQIVTWVQREAGHLPRTPPTEQEPLEEWRIAPQTSGASWFLRGTNTSDYLRVWLTNNVWNPVWIPARQQDLNPEDKQETTENRTHSSDHYHAIIISFKVAVMATALRLGF